MAPAEAGAGNAGAIRYGFGDAEFDPATRELRRGEQRETLQRKPAGLLACLLASAGEVVAREQLLDQVWGRRPTIDNVLSNTIRRLRVALGEPLAARIVAVTQIGYRFDGPVERRIVAAETLAAPVLKAGEPVPRRPEWRLAERLGRSALREVWRARHVERPQTRIFKFGADARALAAMRRERAVSRLIQRSLGPDSGHVRLVDHDWAEPPFLIAAEDAGEDLRAWSLRDPQFAALTREARIALMIEVLAAVGQVHALGILHKDLKPTNLLVATGADGRRRIRIGDFGSALLTEPDRLAVLGITEAAPEAAPPGGGWPGSGSTALYAAPELLTGGVATSRSDLYALGVILYQWLIGDFRQPMATGWAAQIGDPLLVADLEAATQRDPQARLAGVEALAERLATLDRRRRDAEARQAADREAERLRAALAAGRARRPWLIAAGLLLVAGIASTGLQLQRARAAERAALAGQARVEAVNAFLNEDLLALANPLAGASSADPKFSELLALAEPMIDRRLADDPRSAAMVRLSIAEAYAGAGRHREAEALRQTAIGQLQPVVAADDPGLLAARYLRAVNLVSLGRADEARAELAELDGRLAAAGPVPPKLAITAAMVHGLVAQLLVDPEQARGHFLRVLELLDRHRPDDLRQRLNAETPLIDIDYRQRRFADAESRARRLLALDDPQISLLRRQVVTLLLGQVLTYSGRTAEAITHLEPVVAGLRERYGDRHPRTLAAMSALLAARTQSGDWRAAVPEARRIRDGFLATEPGSGLMSLYATLNLGLAELHSGDPAGALVTLGPMLAAFESRLGADNAATHSVRYVLAASALRTGRAQQAARWATALSAERLAEGDPSTPWPEALAALDASIRARLAGHDAALRSRAAEACAALVGRDGASPWLLASVCPQAGQPPAERDAET